MRPTSTTRLAGLFAFAGAGCQVVGGYEEFAESGSAPADSVSASTGGTSHRCDALAERSKLDEGAGTTLVLATSARDRCFWIDRTEVTMAAYQAFLEATERAPEWEPVRCNWKTEASDPLAEPEHPCAVSAREVDPLPFSGEEPARCIDWCDAQAYCQHHGKFLCYVHNTQLIGLETKLNSPDWPDACAGPEASPYPYGSEAEAGVCNVAMTGAQCLLNFGGVSDDVCFPAAAEAFSGCGWAGGPINMVGNVREWAASCMKDATPDSPCILRGGSYASDLEETTCFQLYDQAPRGARLPDVGFRCCAELTAEEESRLPPP